MGAILSPAIENLLTVFENACELPVVPSRPLVLLTNALLGYDDEISEIDEDDPLSPVLDAAIELSESWSFYPDTEFGSSWAQVDFQTVIALQEALEKYQSEQCDYKAAALAW